MKNQDEAWLLREKYKGEKSPEYFADCERLGRGEPLAYVIGHVPFLNCTIWLDSRPLIPRPETEYWVEKAITTIKNSLPKKGLGKNLHILDLCAGSGCIGIALGQAFPEARVTLAEIDGSHIPTIEKNCLVNHVKNTNVIKSNLFFEVGNSFDYIVSNPPYIDLLMDRTDDSVTNFEPHLALYGGLEGTELLLNIVAGAPPFLKRHGELWLEHEPEQQSTIHAVATQYGFRTIHHMDQFGTIRYSRLVLQ